MASSNNIPQQPQIKQNPKLCSKSCVMFVATPCLEGSTKPLHRQHYAHKVVMLSYILKDRQRHHPNIILETFVHIRFSSKDQSICNFLLLRSTM